MLNGACLAPLSLSFAAIAPPDDELTVKPVRSTWATERRGPICDHGMIGTVAMHPTRPLVAASGRRGRSWYGMLKVYDLHSGAVLDSWLQDDGRYSELDALAFSHEGSLMAAGNQSGTISLWELPNPEASREQWALRIRGKWSVCEPVTTLTFHPTDPYVLAGGASGIVHIIDIREKSARTVFRPGPRGDVTSLRFLSDGDTVATSHGSTGAVATWSFRNRRPLRVLERDAAFATDTAYLRDGRLLVAYGYSGGPFLGPIVEMEHPEEQLRIWDYRTGKLVKAWLVGGHRVNSISSVSDDRILIAGYEDHESPTRSAIAVLDAKTGERVGLIQPWWGASHARVHAVEKSLIVFERNRIGAWHLADDHSACPRWQDQWNWWDEVLQCDP